VTAPAVRGSGTARVAQWRKPVHPIWRAPGTVACRGEDTGLFYRAEGESPVARESRVEKARGLCQGCCASTECLEAAMAEEKDGGGRHGMRGGLTEHQRKDLQVSRTLKARKAREREERETGTGA
jgi:hypothetical protein